MPRAWCRTTYSKARCGCMRTSRRPSTCTASLAGDLKVGRCQDNGFTLRRSLITGAQWTPADIQGPVCKHFCDCQWPGYAPAASLPVCQDVPDDPAKGEFCSLCGPNAPGNCGGAGGACTQGIAFFLPTPTSMKSISATTT